MSPSDCIEIRTTRECAECLAPRFGARELRDLASNAGVSRERGDTKTETAVKIAEQDPALAARLVENDPDVGMDASAFREAREAGGGPISLDEAARRARHRGMARKLESLGRALAKAQYYEAEVDWEYGGGVDADPFRASPGYVPGITSVRVSREDDAPDVHWLLDGSAHALLSPHGKCSHLDVDAGGGGTQYIDSRDEPEPRKQWSLAMRRIESFYDD